MKKIVLLVLVQLLSIYVRAYDFCEDGIYYNILSTSEMTIEVTYKDNVLLGSYSGSITIPEIVHHNNESYTVTSIGYSAFRFCNKMTSINIPTTITQIKQDAFSSSGINNIIIPSSVVSIGSDSFDGCYSLTQLTIEDSNETLELGVGGNPDHYEFASCPLSEVYIGRNIAYSSYNSPFFRISSIEKVLFGSGITTLNSALFLGCDNIKDIRIPQNITSIETRVFSGCSSLKVVEFEDGDIPLSFISSTSYPQFDGCSIDSVYLGRNISGEARWVFLRAFVSSVMVGEYVDAIPFSLFNGRGVQYVYLSKNIQSVQAYSFAYNSIKDVYCYSTSVIPLYSDGFAESSISTATLHVPLSSLDDYRNHSVWGSFGSIVPIAEELLGNESDGVYFSSFYNGKYNYTVDTNTTAYTASYDNNNKTLVLTTIQDKIIKAGQGVILKSNSNNISLVWTETTATDSYFSNNILSGTDVEIPTSSINGVVYVLGHSTDGVGFYKYIGEYLRPHRAFMHVDDVLSAPARILLDFENHTRILNVHVCDQEQQNVFDCLGRKTCKLTKGIYIINGKKYSNKN